MDSIDIFIDSYLDISFRAMTREGITDDDCDNLINSLSVVKGEYQDKDCIPKKLVNVFIDMLLYLWHCLEQQENIYNNIEQANKLKYLVNQLQYIAASITAS